MHVDSERLGPREGDDLLYYLCRSPPKNCKNDLTIKLDGNWSSFQLAISAPPLSVTGSAIAPSARMPPVPRKLNCFQNTRWRMLFSRVQTPCYALLPGRSTKRNIKTDTPKGAPHLAKCHAKATREQDASKLTNQTPREKLM